MKLPKHRQFTMKRFKARVKNFLFWVSALTVVLTLVKLVVEISLLLQTCKDTLTNWLSGGAAPDARNVSIRLSPLACA